MKLRSLDILPTIKFEYRITFMYLIFGFLWILFSDETLDVLVVNDSLLTHFQTLKGTFFILVTSGFLYVLVKSHMKKLRFAEAQRIESESHYRALFFDNPSVNLLINPGTGSIEEVNQAACRYYGLTHTELCRKSIYDLTVSDAALIPVLLETESSRMHDPFEFQHRLSGGEIREVEIIAGPIRLVNKTRLYTQVRDITEQKRAEDKIRILNNELEHRVMERTSQLEYANKEMEAFSYSVSHDLRAPLRHINGYVELLNEELPDDLPEALRYYIVTIRKVSIEMGTLIDDLLDFARTGRQMLEKTTLDMAVLVNEVLEKIRPDIQNREIVWSVGALPVVVGDYSLLKQVWVNLIQNAVKYSKFKQPAEISIGYKEENDRLVFYIRDNGVGFDMKYAHKLFGVFQRLHSRNDFEGTGIGLANAQRIVHKHSGQIWAEAEPGQGATFYFSLPKKP